VVVRFRNGLLIVTAEAGEAEQLAGWLRDHAGQVFRVREVKGRSAVFQAIGPEDEACRVPLNITSRLPVPLRAISNFAHAPFMLDGLSYASIEGFWQGLKFPDEADRRRVAALYGGEAKTAGSSAPAADRVTYRGESIAVGTWAHWRLMERACEAKFEQNAEARHALIATGTRPLVHRVKRDSRTIPGVIIAQIWTRTRARLAKAGANGGKPSTS